MRESITIEEATGILEKTLKKIQSCEVIIR